MLVAEALGRLDTVGIDCIAMNVNDVICVGADPIAVLDYIAVEEADPAALEQIARGLAAGAEQAGVEIPGGELAVLPELIRGHPSPNGFDLLGFCVGLVDLDAVITGARIEAGDALIGLPSSGVHSNGLTLARHALGDADERLLEPTVIYVRAVRELLDSGVDVRGLAHITGDGFLNLLRLEAEVGYLIDQPLPVPEVFAEIATARRRGRRGDVRGLQHGLRLLRGGPTRRRRRGDRDPVPPPPRHGADRPSDGHGGHRRTARPGPARHPCRLRSQRRADPAALRSDSALRRSQPSTTLARGQTP